MDSFVALPESMIESARQLLYCESLQVHAKTQWGSLHPDNRLLIRAEATRLTCPELPHSSISHTADLGLLVMAPHPVGVDVETTARVAEKVVARISSVQELQQSPNPSALWCAKEACFKALRSYDQPSVISKLTIGDWQKIDSQTETFTLLNSADFNSPSDNRGVILRYSSWSFGFFIFSS